MNQETLPVQIDYTSRDYASLREDLIARVKARIPEWNSTDESDFGVALVEAFAYMGDLMSYYIDRAANESSLSTARRRQNVLALARDLGYESAGYSPSSVQLTFINTSANPILIPKRTVVSARVTVNDLYLNIPFETDDQLIIASNTSQIVNGTQGETRLGPAGYGESLGLSYGNPRQIIEVPDSNVLRESVQVYVFDGVNYQPWQRVDHISDYSPLSRVYRVRDTGDNITFVEFGDGVSGLVPATGYALYATYRVVDGTNGNVPIGSIQEVTDIPGVTSTELAVLVGSLSVTNDTPGAGGTDPEDTESVRFNARQTYRTAGRAVTVEDFQNIALSIPNCGKASAQSSTPSSVLLCVAPYRNVGGSEDRPGSAYNEVTSLWESTVELNDLQSSVDSLVGSASLIGTALTITDPIYSPVAITIDVESIDSLRQVDCIQVVSQALFEQFDYARMPFGAVITMSDIIALITSLGVARSVTVSVLKRVASGSSSNIIEAASDEIFIISSDDVVINVTGGIGA